jgi:hypothetical protein
MANKRVAGTCYVYQDGRQVSLGGTFNIGPSTVNRESVSGLSGRVGVKETWVSSYMEAEIIKTPDLRLTDIEKITDATITAELADGTTAVLYNACQVGELEYSAADGTVTVRWDGNMMEI